MFACLGLTWLWLAGWLLMGEGEQGVGEKVLVALCLAAHGGGWSGGKEVLCSAIVLGALQRAL